MKELVCVDLPQDKIREYCANATDSGVCQYLVLPRATN